MSVQDRDALKAAVVEEIGSQRARGSGNSKMFERHGLPWIVCAAANGHPQEVAMNVREKLGYLATIKNTDTQFSLLPTHEDFARLIHVTKKGMTHFNELIRENQPVVLVMDLDIEVNEADPPSVQQTTKELLSFEEGKKEEGFRHAARVVLDTLNDAMSHAFDELQMPDGSGGFVEFDDTCAKVLVCPTKFPKKLSIHWHYPVLFVDNLREQKVFWRVFQEVLKAKKPDDDGDMWDLLYHKHDMSIYEKNRAWRCVYSTKKPPADEKPPVDHRLVPWVDGKEVDLKSPDDVLTYLTLHIPADSINISSRLKELAPQEPSRKRKSPYSTGTDHSAPVIGSPSDANALQAWLQSVLKCRGIVDVVVRPPKRSGPRWIFPVDQGVERVCKLAPYPIHHRNTAYLFVRDNNIMYKCHSQKCKQAQVELCHLPINMPPPVPLTDQLPPAKKIKNNHHQDGEYETKEPCVQEVEEEPVEREEEDEDDPVFDEDVQAAPETSDVGTDIEYSDDDDDVEMQAIEEVKTTPRLKSLQVEKTRPEKSAKSAKPEKPEKSAKSAKTETTAPIKSVKELEEELRQAKREEKKVKAKERAKEKEEDEEYDEQSRVKYLFRQKTFPKYGYWCFWGSPTSNDLLEKILPRFPDLKDTLFVDRRGNNQLWVCNHYNHWEPLSENAGAAQSLFIRYVAMYFEQTQRNLYLDWCLREMKVEPSERIIPSTGSIQDVIEQFRVRETNEYIREKWEALKDPLRCVSGLFRTDDLYETFISNCLLLKLPEETPTAEQLRVWGLCTSMVTRGDPGMYQFDEYQHQLAFNDGLFWPYQSKLVPIEPSDHVRHTTGYNYIPPAPNDDEVIEGVFRTLRMTHEEEGQVEQLFVWLFVSFMGVQAESLQKCLFWYTCVRGQGAAGRSKMFEALKKMGGQYVVEDLPASIILPESRGDQRKTGDFNPEYKQMHSARLLLFTECTEEFVAGPVFKRYTAEATVSGRGSKENTTCMKNRFGCLIQSNFEFSPSQAFQSIYRRVWPLMATRRAEKKDSEVWDPCSCVEMNSKAFKHEWRQFFCALLRRIGRQVVDFDPRIADYDPRDPEQCTEMTEILRQFAESKACGLAKTWVTQMNTKSDPVCQWLRKNVCMEEPVKNGGKVKYWALHAATILRAIRDDEDRLVARKEDRFSDNLTLETIDQKIVEVFKVKKEQTRLEQLVSASVVDVNEGFQLAGALELYKWTDGGAKRPELFRNLSFLKGKLARQNERFLARERENNSIDDEKEGDDCDDTEKLVSVVSKPVSVVSKPPVVVEEIVEFFAPYNPAKPPPMQKSTVRPLQRR